MKGLKFEQATPGDEQRLESLSRAAFETYVRLLGREISESPYDRLSNAVKEGHIWVAIRDDDIVGAVRLVPEGDSWFIDEIAVPPELQGKGIGSWLLTKIEDLARNQGIKSLNLYTAKMRSDLVRLYERFGFGVVSEGLPKHGMDYHLRVFMEKALD